MILRQEQHGFRRYSFGNWTRRGGEPSVLMF
jgi:hypothetical protein